jgi:hypothetical protein
MIKAQYKLALGLMPFLAAGAMASVSVLPAYQDDETKRAEVVTKKQENQTLINKLRERKKAEAERTDLQGQIEQLRGAVPKQPELDLFMLDLERMCKDSHVDLISVEEPEAETLKSLDASEASMRELAQDSSGKVGLGTKTLENRNSTAQKGKDKEKQQDQSALKQLIKQVYVTSDYDGIVELMKRLENYQRITGVKQVCVALPSDTTGGMTNPAGDRAKKLKLKGQPVMSFLMTLYYLP